VGLEGRIVSHPKEKFKLTFEGYDEYGSVHGFGWFRKLDEDTVEGEVVSHDSDKSKLQTKGGKRLQISIFR